MPFLLWINIKMYDKHSLIFKILALLKPWSEDWGFPFQNSLRNLDPSDKIKISGIALERETPYIPELLKT